MAAGENPFRGFAKRLAGVPLRAVQLPFQLAGELLGKAPGSLANRVVNEQNASEQTQRALNARVTGQPPPEASEGRRFANMLSLGLIPGNEPAQVDPNNLNPEQQERFGELNPLQQALLQAKDPRSFADILMRDDFFQERSGPEPQSPLGRVGADVQAGFVSPSQARAFEEAEAAKALPKPQSPVGRIGADVQAGYIDEETGHLAIEKNLADGTGMTEYQREQLRLREAGLKNQEEGLRLRREAAVSKTEDVKPIDPNVVFDNEASLQTRVQQNITEYVKQAAAFRTSRELFNVQDPQRLHPETLRGLKTIMPDFDEVVSTAPRAISDIGMVYSFFRVTDPGGRVTDNEREMLVALQQKLGGFLGVEKTAEILGNLVDREPLTDEQRAQMAIAMNQVFSGSMAGHDRLVLSARNAALRNRLRGMPLDPANIIDPLEDVRSDFGRAAGVSSSQARYPLADEQAESLLSEVFVEEKGHEPSSSGEFIRFSNRMGYRVDLAE